MRTRYLSIAAKSGGLALDEPGRWYTPNVWMLLEGGVSAMAVVDAAPAGWAWSAWLVRALVPFAQSASIGKGMPKHVEDMTYSVTLQSLLENGV